MSLAFGILGFLNYEPMSGYDLAKAFESSLQFFWHAQNSHIYLELKNLEKKNISAAVPSSSRTAPTKKFIRSPGRGKKRLWTGLPRARAETPHILRVLSL